jgi:hypothetical protein
MELTLKRVSMTDDGVIGVLLSGTYPVCLTLEEEWRDNAKGISCIPEGSYLCKRTITPKHGETFEVMNVPGGRTAILFHSGNTESDTQGCILTGMEYSFIDAVDEESGIKEKQIAVLRSREAFKLFMEACERKETFALHVKWC